MFQIVYISAAAEPMNADALEHLLGQCRTNNPRCDLTGLLIYKDGRFMQALEGPKEHVEHIFATIKGDDRHTGVVQMAGHPIEERDFPGCPMAFRAEGNPEPVDVGGFTPFMNEDFLTEHFTDDLSFSHRMLLDFVDADQRRKRRKELRRREKAVQRRTEMLDAREEALEIREKVR